MAGKIILYILGVLFIIPGLGNLLTGFAIPNNYEQLRNGKIGFGIIFLLIGSILIWAGSKIKVGSSSSSDVPEVPPLPPTPPKPPVPVAPGDTSFTVIKNSKQAKKNVYLLDNKEYGGPIHIRSDVPLSPGEIINVDMRYHEISTIKNKRSLNNITYEKWLIKII